MTSNSSVLTGVAEVHGARLYYEMAGQGHPLVLIHAGVADLRMWDDTFPLFAQHFQTIRYDMRGFGHSTMPPGPFTNYDDLAGLLQALAVGPAYVIGVSIAGRAALECSLAHPDQVDAVVCVASRPGPTPPSALAQPFFAGIDAAYEAHDVARALDLETQLWLVGPGRTPEAVSPALKERFQAMDGAQIARELAGEAGTLTHLSPPLSARLGEVRVPTLVVVGAADLPEVQDGSARLAAEIPGAREVVFPDAAHLLPMEHPQEFAALVLEFLGGI